MKTQPYVYCLISAVLLLLCSCATEPKKEIAPFKRTPARQVGKRIIFDMYQIPESGITYYFRAGEKPDSPLLLTIQGSGCDSIYSQDAQGNFYGGMNVEAADSLGTRAAILAVEKPDTHPFFVSKNRGSAEGCSEDFKKDFIKDRWLNFLTIAMQDAILVNQLHPSRIIVAGHSEGGEVAAFLAGETPEITHVLMGGGGGAIQLYEFIIGATTVPNGERMDRTKESKTVHQVLDGWAAMAKYPNVIEPLYMGHTPRYWTTFKKSSPAEALKKSSAKIYIIQGTDDPSSPVTSADMLAAELTVTGREFIYDRVPKANHALVINGKNNYHEIWAKAFEWSLK
jgi:predicted esterase